MIRFKKGDILFEDAEALVNTVNCVGIMGRGIALQFRKAFPENFHTYAEACKRGEVRPGHMFVHATRALTNPRYIVNFPTKRHWRGDSRIEDIEAGLRDLARVIREYDIRSIAVPPLGSGLGGLDWPIVRARIEEALGSLNDVGIVVFEPVGAPAAGGMVRHDEVPTMTEGRAALVGLMDRYLNGLLEPFITLLEVHKLLYFMQIAGQPLNLRFRAGSYGPYAENLRHVLNKVEGHFISGYADGGDAPDKQLQLVPGAIDAASGVLRSACETRERFDKVASLVAGFESAFGLELLSTVHWILERETPASLDALVATTYSWNDRKRQFSRRQIKLAADVLRAQGWTEAAAPVALQ